MRHLVIGLGEIGGPLRDVLASGPDEVHGRDLVEQCAGDSFDCLHICYPFTESFARVTLDYLDQYDPTLCVIHSTAIPGTSRAVDEVTDSYVAYSPVRGRRATMRNDLLHYVKFVSGKPPAIAMAQDALRRAGFRTAVITPVEALELAKLLSTTYFGLLVAWAQEMERYCRSVGGEYLDVAAFFAEHPNFPVSAFLPGVIAGHCVIPNLELLETVKPSPFIEAIRESNARRIKAGVSGDGLRPLPLQPLLDRAMRWTAGGKRCRT